MKAVPSPVPAADRAPAPEAALDIAVVVATNDSVVLGCNLLRSPALMTGRMELHVERDPVSAAAYNRGLDAVTAEIVLFAHHDVFLPEGWERLLARRISQVARCDPDWALIGAYGLGRNGWHYGPVWSSSLGQIIDRPPLEPVPAQSFDEPLIVMRRDAGLRFDKAMPWFHFYDADIVQSAWAAGRSAWVAPLPLVHNDRTHDQLGSDYAAAYHAMRRKWRARLPIATPTVKISWHGLHLRRNLRHLARVGDIVRAQALPVEIEPERYAALCGWTRLGEDLE